MKIGVYYYPEQWPREQWKRDFDNIAAMGMQIIHFAEFAWFTMEPRPGEFRFDWLDECLEMSRQRGLDVILCTPTAAPPIWLTETYPDVLPLDEHGQRARHGGRRHYSPTSPAMRDATTRIVTAMAEHFGNHPSVIGWQIDNEYGGAFDQNDHAHAAFQNWLKRKYTTIEQLNHAWGNEFWNQYYTEFSQIRFPKSRDPVYANPHHHLDASRFWSWAWADFNRLQANILRARLSVVSGPLSVAKHAGSSMQRTTDDGQRTIPFITTNFMPLFLDCDPLEMAEDLSLFSWDCYPVTGWDKTVVDETFRMADPVSIGLVHDQMASYTGRWAQMELQPGQINWSGVPVQPYPGAVRLWIWTAFAHGAEFVTTYRYRQPRFGIELFHHALAGPDGVTLSRGGKEFAQVASELQRLTPSPLGEEGRGEGKAQPSSIAPVQETIGLLLDFDQLWYFKTLPQSRKWDQPAHLKMWYAAIKRLGLNVRILHPGRDLPADLPLIIVPAMQILDESEARRFESYVSRGGHLMLTCRTGLMNRNGQLWEGPMAMPILPLIGARVDEYDVMPDDALAHVEMDGKRYAWNVWGDLIVPDPQTHVLARYADQFYAGTAAVTQRRHGQGTATYCGVYPQLDFIDALMEKLSKSIGLPAVALPSRVHLMKRGPYHILLNYRDESVEAPAPAAADFVIGQRTVGPADVAIWR